MRTSRRPTSPRGISGLSRAPLATALALAALGQSACDESKKPGPTSAPSAAVATASAGGASASASAKPVASAPPAASAKPFAEKLKCETLLPEAQRLSLGLLNFKLSQQATCPECGPTCSLVRPDRPFEGVSIAYTCNVPYEKAAADKTLEELKKNTFKKPAPITAGRGGMMGEKDNGAFYAAVVYDDDSDCKIAIDWMKGDRKLVEPLVKVAVTSLKQTDVSIAKQ